VRKDKFFERLRNLPIDQRELERKWKTYLREQEELQLLMEAAGQSGSSTPPGGVGGSAGSASPVEAGAPAIMVVYVGENGNFQIVIVNFSTETISEPIDTGVLNDGNSYAIESLVVTQEKGFMSLVYDSPNDQVVATFVSVNGELLEVVKSETYGWGNLEYNGTYLVTYSNSGTEFTVHLFDGEVVVPHTFENTEDYSDIGGSWGDKFGSLGVIVTVEPVESPNEVYLLRWDGTREQLFVHDEEANLGYSTMCSLTTNFMLVLVFDDNSQKYTQLLKWNSDLSVEEIDLFSNDTYDSLQYSAPYGSSKAILLFYNNEDNQVPWMVCQVSDSSARIDYHTKDVYSNAEVYCRMPTPWEPANVNSEKAVILFRSPPDKGFPYQYSYFDIHYYTDENLLYEYPISEETAHIIRWNGDYPNGGMYGSDPAIVKHGRNSPEVFILILTNGGVSEIVTGIDKTDVIDSSIETYAIYPYEGSGRILLEYDLDSLPNAFWKIYDSAGVILSKTTSQNFGSRDSLVTKDTVILVYEDNYEDNIVWSNSGGLVDPLPDWLEVFDVLGSSDVNFATEDALQPGIQAIFVVEGDEEDFELKFYIFDNAQGLRGPFDSPADIVEILSIRLGKSSVYLYYLDSDSRTISNKYSLQTGQLLSGYAGAPEAEASNIQTVGDRNYIVFSEDGSFLLTFLYNSKTQSISAGVDYQLSFNDSAWSYYQLL
jgi:hypothetical protein